MKKHKKFKPPIWGIIIAVELVTGIVLYAFGFKITYAPELENDWGAIEAVGTWVCGLLVPFALIIFERKLSTSEKRISTSNLATLEELNEFRKKYEPLLKEFSEGEVVLDAGDASEYIANKGLPSQHEIYRFICISMIASSQEIANYFGVEVDSLRNRIQDMWAVQEIISPATLSDDPNGNFANCNWTKAK